MNLPLSQYITNDKLKEYTLVVLISLIPLFLIYLPFLMKTEQLFFLSLPGEGMSTVLKNWDGPHYIAIARTWYNEAALEKFLFAPVPVSTDYYAAHFPLLPFFIFLLSPIFGWLYSGVAASILFGLLLNIIFYIVAKKYTKYPLLLTFVFTVFPPRFLIVKSIIAPETLLVFCIFVSLLLWEKKAYFWSGLAGFFATLTKMQGIILFPAYVMSGLEHWYTKKRIEWRMLWALLIPGAYLLISVLYLEQYGNFYAFFDAQKSVEMQVYFPFSQFNVENVWTRNAWLEDVVFYFVSMFTLAYLLHKDKKRSWFYFSVIYSLFLVFIPQRDITRFAVPLVPLFLLRFEKFFTSRAFIVGLCCALPAIYFYVINFLIDSAAPVTDWAPYFQ
jgi:hypothetical protein